MPGTPTDPTDPSSSASSQSAPSSPVPRRITTPRWFDLRLVAGVVLVLASVLIGARVVAGAGKTYGTVTVRHDLAAGKVLTAADLTTAQVQLPDHGKRVYVSRVDDAIGKQLRRDVSAGELLPADAISAAAQRTTLTIPLATGASPDLRAGDRIEVWLTSASCSSVVLLPVVTVQSVHNDASGSFTTGGTGQDVVISVTPDVAGRVATALAIDQAQLRAGVLTGPAAPTDPPTDAPSLPDITVCASAAPSK